MLQWRIDVVAAKIAVKDYFVTNCGNIYSNGIIDISLLYWILSCVIFLLKVIILSDQVNMQIFCYFVRLIDMLCNFL